MNDATTTPVDGGVPRASVPADDAPAPDTTQSPADDGQPVVFTPDDVTLPPPDHPPTDAAPESEKAGLIFERS